ncbi:MAG: DUF4286 family protein [Ginsengibacter sp.]
MLIYNITIKIDNDIESEWVTWQKVVYIPGVMASGFFYDNRFSKLISHEDTDGKTYVMQFYAKNKDAFENFKAQHADEFSDLLVAKWGNKFVAFESLLAAVQ